MISKSTAFLAIMESQGDMNHYLSATIQTIGILKAKISKFFLETNPNGTVISIPASTCIYSRV